MHFATFSIAAYDPDESAWGVAVASKFLAVGAYVPFARAMAGAVATQALVNITYGAQGLALLSEGTPAQLVLDKLIAADEGRDHRQVGMVDASGGAASYTGSKCMNWAGGATGEGYAIQGNILAGPQVVESMRDTFVSAPGSFAQRLMRTLKVGDLAGGDKRGRQSAALVIVKPGGGYGGTNDRCLDLRVDDHIEPIGELSRLLTLHTLYFGITLKPDKIALAGHVLIELQNMMIRQGYLSHLPDGTFDPETRAALRTFTGVENLEERVDLDLLTIDPPALDYLRSKFSGQANGAAVSKVVSTQSSGGLLE